MYAVIETGGKQYLVSEGVEIKVEKLPSAPTKPVVFDKVMLLFDDKTTKVGNPYLANTKVEGVVKEQGKAKKVRIVKFKRRKRYLKSTGHRQRYTAVEISKIKSR